MKLCGSHLHDLNNAIRHKGMAHLVATSGTEATERAQKWLVGMCPAHEFDPLIVSILEIYKKASEILGRNVEKGTCPLCAVQIKLADDRVANVWIDKFTDLMIGVCETNNIKRRIVIH